MDKDKGEYGCKLSWGAGKKTVLCIGTTAIDYFNTVRRFPEENQVTKASKGYWQRGGGASINCTVLAKLGVKCEFFGMLSSMDCFRELIDDLTKSGIVSKNCPTCDQCLPFTSILITKNPKSVNRLDFENEEFPHVTIDDFRKLDFDQYGWIHVHCHWFDDTLAMLKDVSAYNDAHPNEKIIISLSFWDNLDEMWPLIDYCDYAFFSRRHILPQNGTNPHEAAKYIDERLRMRWGLNLNRPFVIVLWGTQGAGIMDRSGNYSHVDAYAPVRNVDPYGAGQVFVAALIYAVFVRERPFAVAVDFANRMASFKCARYGYNHIAKILLPPVL